MAFRGLDALRVKRLLGTEKRVTPVFQRVLSHADWWKTALETASGSISCPAGKWTRIGEFTIPAQQKIRFGYGSAVQPMNQGYLHIALYDDTATNSELEDGLVRLIQMNANETQLQTVYEGRTENLRGDVNDKNKMIALPERTDVPENLVGEDCKLAIEFKADSADSLVKTAIGTAAAKDIWNIPVSVYE